MPADAEQRRRRSDARRNTRGLDIGGNTALAVTPVYEVGTEPESTPSAGTATLGRNRPGVRLAGPNRPASADRVGRYTSCVIPLHSPGDAVNNKVRALDTRRKVGPALDTPTDLVRRSRPRALGQAQRDFGRRVSRSISRPRISIGMSAARISAITICCSTSSPSRFSPPPTRSPSACARSAAPRCAPSARSRNCRQSRTTTRDLCRPTRCCAS